MSNQTVSANNNQPATNLAPVDLDSYRSDIANSVANAISWPLRRAAQPSPSGFAENREHESFKKADGTFGFRVISTRKSRSALHAVPERSPAAPALMELEHTDSAAPAAAAAAASALMELETDLMDLETDSSPKKRKASNNPDDSQPAALKSSKSDSTESSDDNLPVGSPVLLNVARVLPRELRRDLRQDFEHDNTFRALSLPECKAFSEHRPEFGQATRRQVFSRSTLRIFQSKRLSAQERRLLRADFSVKGPTAEPFIERLVTMDYPRSGLPQDRNSTGATPLHPFGEHGASSIELFYSRDEDHTLWLYISNTRDASLEGNVFVQEISQTDPNIPTATMVNCIQGASTRRIILPNQILATRLRDIASTLDRPRQILIVATNGGSSHHLESIAYNVIFTCEEVVIGAPNQLQVVKCADCNKQIGGDYFDDESYDPRSSSQILRDQLVSNAITQVEEALATSSHVVLRAVARYAHDNWFAYLPLDRSLLHTKLPKDTKVVLDKLCAAAVDVDSEEVKDDTKVVLGAAAVVVRDQWGDAPVEVKDATKVVLGAATVDVDSDSESAAEAVLGAAAEAVLGAAAEAVLDDVVDVDSESEASVSSASPEPDAAPIAPGAPPRLTRLQRIQAEQARGESNVCLRVLASEDQTFLDRVDALLRHGLSRVDNTTLRLRRDNMPLVRILEWGCASDPADPITTAASVAQFAYQVAQVWQRIHRAPTETGVYVDQYETMTYLLNRVLLLVTLPPSEDLASFQDAWRQLGGNNPDMQVRFHQPTGRLAAESFGVVMIAQAEDTLSVTLFNPDARVARLRQVGKPENIIFHTGDRDTVFYDRVRGIQSGDELGLYGAGDYLNLIVVQNAALIINASGARETARAIAAAF